MAFKFPFTNYHELNLTWVLDQLKKLFEESAENVSVIQDYDGRLTAVETELPTVSETASEASRNAAAAATLAQTAKATADTAQENAIQAQRAAGTAQNTAERAQEAADAATQAAQQAQAIVQDFDGRITQAEADSSEALQEAQSFENRVNAAINTANNAANTATIAQGIAVNANQNAATALDTAQTADGKAEAAQDAADIADGKAEAAQDAADIADGKAEAAQDAADIADGKAEAAQDTANLADEKADTNAANIGNLADLTTTAKNNLVAAINEAAQSGGSGDNTNCAPIIISIASGNIATFTDGADNKKIRKIVGTIVTPSGSNGRTEANISIVGKNLFPYETIPTYSYEWYSHGASFLNASNPLFLKGGVTYVLSVTPYNAGTTNSVYMRMWDANKAELLDRADILNAVQNSYRYTYYATPKYYYFTQTAISGTVVVIIQPTQDIWIDMIMHSGDGAGSNPQIEVGTTVTVRETYHAQNLSINWQTEAGTILNGTVTLNEDGSADVVNSGSGNSYHLESVGNILTYLGVNNVWIDTGAITECDYPADTKLYIDGKLAELQATILENI